MLDPNDIKKKQISQSNLSFLISLAFIVDSCP